MGLRDNETLKAAPEANGSHEMMEMHLFDDNARKENALCGADTSADELRSVDGYLDDRLYGSSVGTVCEGCKVLAEPFAGNLIRHLEGESRVEDAADQRAKSLSFSRRTQSMITLPRAVSITSLAIALSFFPRIWTALPLVSSTS